MEYLEYLIAIAALNKEWFTTLLPYAFIVVCVLTVVMFWWITLDYEYMKTTTAIQIRVRGKDAQEVLDKLAGRAKG